MKTRATYTCEDDNSDFYLAEVDYNHSFTISCEQSLILGGKFPYWKVPGTEYPSKQEIFCAFPTECYNFPDVDPVMAPLGLTDTFDRVHIKNGETYEYVCSLDGNRGLISFLLLSSAAIYYCQDTQGSRHPQLTVRQFFTSSATELYLWKDRSSSECSRWVQSASPSPRQKICTI